MTALTLLVLAATPWARLDEGARYQQAQALHAQPMPGRLAALTEPFLGTPYVLSPLGEGEGKDADPVQRFDAVDCVTMIEEALALGLAPTAEGFLPTLSRIRYFAAPAFDTRNHVTEAQWLPNNERLGLVKDVTARYGGDAVKRVTKRITDQTWKEKGGAALGLSAGAQVKGTFALDIIPAASAAAKLKDAPSGLIVVVVRADRPWLITRVSHMAVLVHTKEGPALRHASRSFGHVVDEPLERYLKRNLDFANWTIDGLAVFEPLDPPPDAG